MQASARLVAIGAAIAASLSVAAPAGAEPSERAGCIAHVVTYFREVTPGPYGLFVSEHAQADHPFGRGVSSIASTCRA